MRGYAKKPDCDTFPRSSWAQRKHTPQTTRPRFKIPINNDGGVMIVQTRPGQTYRETDNWNPDCSGALFKIARAFSLRRVEEMRCAILKLASEPSMGPDRLLSLAIHATTERRASDHPPPTASKITGQKVMPALVHCEGRADEMRSSETPPK